MNYLGELAALGTAAAFAINSVLFTVAGQKVSAIVVNRVRLVFAMLLLVLAHWLVFGVPFPVQVGREGWLWLGLSGFAGLVLGDIFLFSAFVVVGARISMLMMSLAPVIAAVIAWVFLGEVLSPLQILGVLLTLSGVGWVIWQRNGKKGPGNGQFKRGVLLALGGAFGQAVGLVLAKEGMGGGYSPLSGNYIRMITALGVMWAIAFFQKQGRVTISRVTQDGRALLLIAGGAFIGPFLGVSLSLLSLQHTAVGVSSTLTSLAPVFLLPVGYFYFGERFGWQTILATIIAILGVALLFLV
jgi:drug/metabolite transporter (DMT)-like permease